MPLPRLLVVPTLLIGWLAVLLSPLSGPPAAADDLDPVGVWPLQPRPDIVRRFDPPEVVWGPGHRGVDLLGFPGQPVHAALAGTVTFAGVLAGRGVVVVSHGDTRTTYEPVNASVEAGTSLSRGARIGRLELASSHCLPLACLHWGWLRGKTYLDPLELVGAGPVRLLPLWRDDPVGIVPTMRSPYAMVLQRLARFARSPPDFAQARGCACW